MGERALSTTENRGDLNGVKMCKAVDALLRTHARKRVFSRGAVVVAGGEATPGLWCVESGALAIAAHSVGRREFIFRFRQAGEWFGETTLLDGLPWPYTHTASVKTTMLHVTHRDAVRLLAAHPELRSEFVRVTCARLRLTAQYVEEIIVPDLPARLAYHLLVIARESASGLVPGKQLEVHLTQSVLAALLGATARGRRAPPRALARGWLDRAALRARDDPRREGARRSRERRTHRARRRRLGARQEGAR
jgi:CRP-like cAMP-binding protein